MKGKTEKWRRPQLVVLGRGTPEESVLQACKTSKISGPSTTQKNCNKRFWIFACAQNCKNISTTS